MNKTFTNLFSPIKIGSLEIKNRYVMNAMHLGWEENDYVSQRIIDFYIERAKGGVGLIIVGGFKIERIASGPTMLSIADDGYLPNLKKLTTAVKEKDARIFAQLFHAGRYTHSSEIGEQAVSASDVRSRLTGETPRPLSTEEIKRIVNRYSEAANRAKEAGFDGVEVIASTGYLVSQFLSPLSNKRSDEYGGDLVNRMRFGLEIAEAIREEVGAAFPLIFRVSGNDFVKGSNTNREAAIFSKALENSGVDAINVQSGWHEARVPTTQQIVPPGAFVYLASGIKEEVTCPVMTCNKLGDPFLEEEIIRDGLADMVGMARSFLADAYLPQKVQEGRVDEIIRCISCNQGCLDTVFTRRPVTCMVNPFVGKEREWQITPAEAKKKVLVIGGGPGGMEAARIAAIRGHEVLLYEKTDRLGGQITLASMLPKKKEFGILIDNLQVHVKKNGVQVKTGVDVTPEVVEQLDPDAVVVATGAEQRPHSIEGADRENVFTAFELLENDIKIGKRVVIIGGGSLGCEVALLIADKGVVNSETLSFLFRTEAEDLETLKRIASRGAKEVTLITRRDRVGNDIGQTTRWIFLHELRRLNVKIITKAENISITDKGVRFDTSDGIREIPSDTVVISPGMQPVNELYDSLKNNVKEIHLIGDAKEPRKCLEAMYEGAKIGREI
ncbi:MAG: FAD-dependent oxidoreductase [Desulfobacteraceae bacterium]|nr:FAD-dependent oxidoreductase [Desulfobacteraceae bacterium]